MTLKNLVKTEHIIKASLDDNLSTALGHLASSHDAAFIFTDDGKYMGVISPYYSVIKSSYPGTTKVQNCLFHPPKLRVEDTLQRAAQLMSESKVYYLPVFDENEDFIGITTARRVLKLMLDHPAAKLKLSDVLANKNGKLVTVYEDDTLHQALELYKQYKISKLVVIDKNMKLKGVLSYYELIPYLVAPGGKQNRSQNIDERDKFLSMKVKNYAKKSMLTCGMKNTVGEAIQSILTHNMGSVVVVDGESHPVGIFTTRDILNLLREEKDKKQVSLTTKNVSREHEIHVTDLFEHVQKFVEQDSDMMRARVFVRQEKEGILFNISVNLTPKKGEMTVFEKEGKDLRVLIKDAKKVLGKLKQ